MDVAVFALIIVGLAAFVAAPLYRPAPARIDERHDEAGREAIDRALGDLELDHASGLVDQDSYERERKALGPHAQPD